jgi:hypothetical protein
MLSSVTLHCNAAACKGRCRPSVRWRPARGQGGATGAPRKRAHPRPKARDPMAGAQVRHHLPRPQRAARPLAVGAPACTAIRARPAVVQTSHCMAAAQAVAKAGAHRTVIASPVQGHRNAVPNPALERTTPAGRLGALVASGGAGVAAQGTRWAPRHATLPSTC